jgi:hypothetical protein
MQHPDEGAIHAWLDGALSHEEGAEIEAHASACAECASAIAEARGLIAASSRIVSALDIVPAGVIPVRTRVRRPWYATAQLRAAAAVLFVAGASFALLRTGDKQSTAEVSQRVTADASSGSEPAQGPAPLTGEAARPVQDFVRPPEKSAGQTQSAAPSTTNVAPRPPQAATATRSDTRAATGAAAKAAEGVQITTVPPPAAAPAPTLAEAPRPPFPDTASRVVLNKSLPLDEVVVTGVATEAASSDVLRVIRIDSTALTRTTRYRIASGAEVTLVEEANPFSRQGAVARERRFEADRVPAPPPPPPTADSRSPVAATSQSAANSLPVSTITWTDPASLRVYKLSGRVPRETLEDVKAMIQRQKR